MSSSLDSVGVACYYHTAHRCHSYPNSSASVHMWQATSGRNQCSSALLILPLLIYPVCYQHLNLLGQAGQSLPQLHSFFDAVNSLVFSTTYSSAIMLLCSHPAGCSSPDLSWHLWKPVGARRVCWGSGHHWLVHTPALTEPPGITHQ
jgi:hypothetical protein